MAGHSLLEMMRVIRLGSSYQDHESEPGVLNRRCPGTHAGPSDFHRFPICYIDSCRGATTLLKLVFSPSTRDLYVRALTQFENITPIDRLLGILPTDVHRKFLLTAALLRCWDPTLTVTAALNLNHRP